jgi:predicted permease
MAGLRQLNQAPSDPRNRRWFTATGGVDRMLQDLRYAVRTMRRNPVSTAVMIVSLAVGIGATTAIFSVVDGLLLRPLPYPNPDRLAAIWIQSPGIGILRDWPSPGQYQDLVTESRSFEDISISRLVSVALTSIERPERLAAMRTSAGLFRLLGAKALYGRTLLDVDTKGDAADVAVISDGLWRRLFGGDPGVVGRSVALDQTPVTIVGVLSPDFTLNAEVMPAEGPLDQVEVFLPLHLTAQFFTRRRDENYDLIARLKPGVTLQRAQSDVDAIASRIREKDKRDATFGMTVIGLQDQVVGDVRRALLVLLGAVALVLLIACANVANLLLARAAGRQKEVALRAALGARWGRVVRQLLTESVLLGLLGGAAGLLVAFVSLRIVHVMNPGNIPRIDEIGINGTVLVFVLAVSVLTGVVFGLAPVWPSRRMDLNATLKSGGRSSGGGGGLSLSHHSLRGLLVVSELALSLVLVIGAGLLLRSFLRVQDVPAGFATDGIISMQVGVTGAKYKDAGRLVQFYDDLVTSLRAVPGVASAGAVSVLPLTAEVGWGGINVEGFQTRPGQELQADLRTADATYFATMRIPVLEGRAFTARDTPDGAKVVVVDEKFARRFWPNGGAVGRHVWFDPKSQMEIVGVVGDVKQYGLDADAKVVVYLGSQQFPGSMMYVVARSTSASASSAAAAALAGPLADAVHRLESSATIEDTRTMSDRLSDSLARRRFSGAVLAAFAAFALLLALVGVFGVMSYLVAQSRHDIALRLALGATSRDIARVVLGRGLQLTAAGLIAGLAGAFALTRLMSSLLFGVSARDAATFAAVPGILVLLAFAAMLVPVRSAMSVDPIVALRDE